MVRQIIARQPALKAPKLDAAANNYQQLVDQAKATLRHKAPQRGRDRGRGRAKALVNRGGSKRR